MEDKSAGKNITCPFCFKTFKDWQVHFRMEVREDNPLFEPQKDQKYENFWSEYGGTTEVSVSDVASQMGESNGSLPYYRRVYDPHDSRHKDAFIKEDPQANPPCTVLIHDEDGMVIGAQDSFGKETTERVCPYCHNPLPEGYGRYPVKFISTIGVTGAGKTVYLSQLCYNMQEKLGEYGISAYNMTASATRYMKGNIVSKGKSLPNTTNADQLLQPLFFKFGHRNACTQTFVFYDIAGENLVSPENDGGGTRLSARAAKYGKFILHSDAIIFLINPSQFVKEDGAGNDDDKAKKAKKYVPTESLNIISQLFETTKDPKALHATPLAVCISQVEKPLAVAQGAIVGLNICKSILGQQWLPDMQLPVIETEGLPKTIPAFNAEDYNKVRDLVENYASKKLAALSTTLENDFHCYNYFMIESIGVPLVKKRKSSGTVYQVPDKDPTPKRIIEPLLWILTILLIDGSGRPVVAVEGKINEPKGWRCPSCNKWCSDTVTFCPKCGVNKKGEWRCRKCKRLNPRSAEWCESLCCNTNRSGGSRGFFVGLFSRISRGRGA